MKSNVVEAVARGAYECVRALSLAQGTATIPHWEQLEPWRQEDLLTNARRVEEGLAAREVHEAAVADRSKRGWVGGDMNRSNVKSVGYADLVSWEQLPPIERDKVTLFTAAARAMIAPFPVGHCLPVKLNARRVRR